MKIAVVCATFPTLSQTFVVDQITKLIDRGHEVTVFANVRGSYSTIRDKQSE